LSLTRANSLQTVTLPDGKEKDFLRRALNCCFLGDFEPIKASLFCIIRHYICDEKEFNKMRHKEPRDVVFCEFQQQFAKEFDFDVAAFFDKEGYSTLNLGAELERCGKLIERFESQNNVLEKWKRPG
jgi:hypothetical protein